MKYWIAAFICSMLLSNVLTVVGVTGVIYWIAFLCGSIILYHLAARDAKADQVGAE